MTVTSASYVGFSPNFGIQDSTSDITDILVKGKDEEKIFALKRLLVLMSNGGLNPRMAADFGIHPLAG